METRHAELKLHGLIEKLPNTRLILFVLQNNAITIVATTRADSVRQAHLVALRTAGQRRRGDAVVGAPFVPSGFGSLPFWYPHFFCSPF